MQYQKSEPTKKYNPTYRNKSAKIRIAYLSPDFTTNHPIGLLINQVFDLHDSEQFETFGYGLTDYHDAQSKVIEQSFDHFTPLARDSDEVAAEKIHQDDIHILVDLAGYTRSARQGILQYQPAPLQIQYLGFTASMQVNYIQYHITCKEI